MTTRAVTFWSEGTRLAGDLYLPPGAEEGGRYPAIVICHGWGQNKDQPQFRRHGEAFAAAGYVALAFDFRGWGQSDGKVVVKELLPRERTEVSVRVQVIRELVDPFDWTWDVRHAIDFLMGEPVVDPGRVGLWGTSFAGGVVTWTAAHDPRARCVVSQVGVQDQRPAFVGELLKGAQLAAVQEARGEADPLPQGVGDVPYLRGTPYLSKMPLWSPIEYSELLSVPLLLIDTEHESLFDRHLNGELMFKRVQAAGRVPAEYHVIAGARHSQIYDERWEESSDLAIAWFDTHLKAGDQAGPHRA